MKHTAICPRCQCDRIMHVAQVADAGDWFGSGDGDLSTRSGGHPVPREVLTVRRTTKGLFGGESESVGTGGATEAYVCTACGYFEEYLREPHRIDWSRVDGAKLHVPRGGSR